MNIEDLEKLDLDLIAEQIKAIGLSYEETLNLVFKLVPQSDFHNYRWREKIQLAKMKVQDDRGYRVHGPDSDLYSLKSSRAPVKSVGGKYRIRLTTSLGEFGRIDKDLTHDRKDTVCTMFDGAKVILSILIKYDDKFISMYESEQEKKRGSMAGNRQTRDTLSINFRLISEYNLSYEILLKNKDVELPNI
jgi:hypothetical protein